MILLFNNSTTTVLAGKVKYVVECEMNRETTGYSNPLPYHMDIYMYIPYQLIY